MLFSNKLECRDLVQVNKIKARNMFNANYNIYLYPNKAFYTYYLPQVKYNY